MLRKKPLKPKKQYYLKKTPLKTNNSSLKKTTLLKTDNILKKQSDSSKERWEKAKLACIARDNKKCQICGKPGTQVHHIHLRSKRKDLIYHLNNLILLCDRHHIHRGSEKYFEQCQIIANSKNMTVDELLLFAES